MNDTATLAGFGEKPGPGHNEPPTDADALLERLREQHAPLIKRREELLGGIARSPVKIADEDTAGKAADFVDKQINAYLKAAKAVHETEKAPFLAAGRTVDSFWHHLIDDVAHGKEMVNGVRKAYADEKAAAERRRREEEARLAREAEAAARREAEEAAAALKEESDLASALKAEELHRLRAAEADKAAKAAAAKPAELGKSRGEYGGQTSLKQFWNFNDLDRAALDLETLRAHFTADAFDKAVRSWIGANKESLERGARLGGVNIFSDTRL